MSLRRLLFTLSLAALTIPAAAGATHSPSLNPPHDFAVGRGASESGIAFQIAAISGPLGEDPRGHISYRNPVAGIEDSASVTCLLTVGNRAIAGGPSKEMLPGVPVATALYIAVEDNGETAPDRAHGIPFSFFPPNPAGCLQAHFTLLGVLLPVTRGNFVVHDGQPVTP